MIKARGLRLPIYYFFQNHLFDIINGTDTHTWVPNEQYDKDIANLSHGVFYMSSWTNEIKHSFNFIRKYLNNDFQSYKFIDLGCGKGKVVIVWKKMLQKYGLEQKIKGVDYSKKLISIANQNFKKIFNCTGSFELNDVTKINFDSLGSFLIFYLYNPFNEAILNEFFSKLRPSNIIVIYNNPVHHKLLNNYGFELIFRKNGFHYNAQTIIYQKYKP